jgi:putative ATPase
VNVLQAVELVGMPEARICLAQAVCYLACAPKSNRSYLAINKAEEFVKTQTKIETPDHLKSSFSNGKYIYPHDFSKSYIEQNYWPEEIKRQKFYEPKEIGFERKISEWLKYINS